MSQTKTAIMTKSEIEKAFRKLENIILDTFRTDATLGLLQYVIEMLQQEEIELENAISEDVAFFLSKAIENLSEHFTQTRESFQEYFEVLHDLNAD